MDNVPHCKMIEDMLNEARREVKIQSALRLITRGKFSDEDIAGVTELTLEEVKELKAQVSSDTE